MRRYDNHTYILVILISLIFYFFFIHSAASPPRLLNNWKRSLYKTRSTLAAMAGARDWAHVATPSSPTLGMPLPYVHVSRVYACVLVCMHVAGCVCLRALFGSLSHTELATALCMYLYRMCLQCSHHTTTTVL